MTNLIVRGGRALRGKITPSANKNAVLPVLCATLLSDEPITLHRVPDITDVRKLLDFFRNLGSTVEMDFETGTLRLHHGTGLDPKAAHLPLGMRSSIMLIPALLHRFGRASLEEDVTGCTLGSREIDPHIDVFRAFGAEVTSEPSATVITAGKGFSAVNHWLDYASVTTTENFVLCAATANGTSKLTNAACEPHVQEFCEFLAGMGARIQGVGGSRITVAGVDSLGGVEFTFADDFHEVATFLAMGAITGGEISVQNGSVEQFPLLDRTFAKFGVEVTHENGWSTARVDGPLKVREPFTSNILTKVEAAPWPYVPADLLPIFVALGVRAEGQVMFWNKVYDGALGWSSELGKFGAHALLCDPHRLITWGGKPLTPATVESPYIIRVAIALFMLAASIEGESTILNASPIQRAHPKFVENLNALGADVSWVAGD
ncbi:MAG: UDP-N-acetylglucosamine 1-carboxyvinyltransferase [Pseudomonadota bacterium]|uniref:UDP-N-acetylglucosamine 1-carboxyvinyltransferase n=1 Tax=unclassified Phenylobacterium TaxID=2640670 RepID=UPI0006F609D1|nr:MULTISPECIES: UDP-N-acetylglucosamine 1-carboxyvinyltransferase [unclassified Phenylobacterium]KRB49382.1 UDP-N-acetylglucosamine 1-carboxyvinyltransferase [Phenylobacterium sp. Root700]MBT9473691.1 UDP-N-acetylglucosamine 1-carboxyvinyltransferase [Phenylobacterium sp.]